MITSNRARPLLEAIWMHPMPCPYFFRIHAMRRISGLSTGGMGAISIALPSYQSALLQLGHLDGARPLARGTHSWSQRLHLQGPGVYFHPVTPQSGHLAGSALRLLHMWPQCMHLQSNITGSGSAMMSSSPKPPPQWGHTHWRDSLGTATSNGSVVSEICVAASSDAMVVSSGTFSPRLDVSSNLVRY